MPELKAMVDHEQVLTFLKQRFSSPITNLTHLDGGQISRTFSFRAGEQDYIVRFNKDNMLNCNLPKEAYLYHRLASTRIPFPRIVEVGRLGTLYFAISHKAPGHMIEQLPPEEIKQLIPQFIEIMNALHNTDVSDTEGYGVFDYQGKGLASSWRDFLLQVSKEEPEEDFFGKWHHLFEDTFLERDLFGDIYRQMKQLLDYVPTERYLVHGGLSLRNMLAQDGKITAVLDWVDAKYGDFVYDVVVMDFWYPWLHMSEHIQQDYQQRQLDIPFYKERLLCYHCHMALDAMRFYAFTDQEPSYQFVRQHILERLATLS